MRLGDGSRAGRRNDGHVIAASTEQQRQQRPCHSSPGAVSGVGLAGKASYHAYTLTHPARVVIDFTHVKLGRFPGVWDITSWPQYWAVQYAWNNGHQPWRGNPSMVVEAWARSRWNTTPTIQQVGPDTFRVTEPGTTKVDTVTGVRPVNVPGPWVITAITPGPGGGSPAPASP